MLAVEGIDLFYGASHCLRKVSLSALKGQVTCLLGRNGVGKTSLLRAIMGLEPTKAGRITWEGNDITRMAPHLTHVGVHDHGFNNVSTYGALWRMAREGQIEASEWEMRFYALALKVSGGRLM